MHTFYRKNKIAVMDNVAFIRAGFLIKTSHNLLFLFDIKYLTIDLNWQLNFYAKNT